MRRSAKECGSSGNNLCRIDVVLLYMLRRGQTSAMFDIPEHISSGRAELFRELRYHGHDTGTSMGNKAEVKGPMGNFPAFILFGGGQLGHLGEEAFKSE